MSESPENGTPVRNSYSNGDEAVFRELLRAERRLRDDLRSNRLAAQFPAHGSVVHHHREGAPCNDRCLDIDGTASPT